ncbi:MAG: XdhC family protein [Pseudomonadota bacterium]
MRHKNTVFDQIRRWRSQATPVVLAIVRDTVGSTYSKVGDFIALTASGAYQGLVSGGCVEGDLAERARRVVETGIAEDVHYDLGGEHDAIWGMGAGCDGELRIRLVPVGGSFERTLETAMVAYDHGRSGLLLIGLSDDAHFFLEDSAGGRHAGVDMAREVHALLEQRRSAVIAGGDSLAVYLRASPSILICGAAPDAEPLIEVLLLMGWQVTVVDHRPAYVADLADSDARTEVVDAAVLSEQLALQAFDAAMIMSHHLETDTRYLECIASTHHWTYIGLLGPGHRRQKLLATLSGDQRHYLDDRINGPAGIDIGAREPAGIALSIAAEMHTAFAAAGRV